MTVRAGFPPEDTLDEADLAAARWCWEKNHVAGRGSDTLPGAKRLFQPMSTGRGAVGVVGIDRDEPGPILTPDQQRLLDALADQAALAIERVNLVEDVDRARLVAETDRLRSALLTSISHDLRTPLASILGSATSLPRRATRSTRTTRLDLTRNIQDEAERLNRFIGNLLDMTRLESGPLRLDTGPIELSDVIGTALRRARKILAGHRTQIDLAARPADARRRCGAVRAGAVQPAGQRRKYAPAGSLITIRAWRDDGRVAMQVMDEGPGIPPVDLERIFDKFYRVGGADRRRAGTGLGLAICRGFVEAMDGTITASNRTDRSGAMFTIKLPAFVAAERPIGDDRVTTASGPLRILVVDDEPAILRFLRAGLGSQGYLVVEAATGQAALDAVKQRRADLIVLDLGLPDIDGLDVIRRIREGGAMQPIIVLSSRDDEAAKVAALDLGADDYVTKPFGIDELLARIRAAQRHRLQQQGEKPIFRTGDLTMDLVRRIVTVRGKEVKFSPREYDLLRLLVAHAGKVLTHNMILREVWGPEYRRAVPADLHPGVASEDRAGYRQAGVHPDGDRRGLSPEGARLMRIGDVIGPDQVVVGLRVGDKAQLLQELASRAGAALDIDRRIILDALQARENLGSTGLGKGFALPHARLDAVARPFALFARLARPIDFAAIDGKPVDLVILLLTPANGGNQHLATLAALSRPLRNEALVQRLRRASDATEAYNLLAGADA